MKRRLWGILQSKSVAGPVVAIKTNKSDQDHYLELIDFEYLYLVRQEDVEPWTLKNTAGLH